MSRAGQPVAADLDHVPPGPGAAGSSCAAGGGLVPDGRCHLGVGMAAHGRVSCQSDPGRYAAQHHPRGSHLGRGRARSAAGGGLGGLEECAAPGLVTTFISRARQRRSGAVDGRGPRRTRGAHLPQGRWPFLIEGQARGQFDRVSAVGSGVPRSAGRLPGRPSCRVRAPACRSPTRARLRLSVATTRRRPLPAPYADSAGNIYAGCRLPQ